MRRRGFTLVDLMITVTLLGILAAVALPVFNGHLERSNRASAESTHYMVRRALDLYYQHHKTFPPTLEPLEFVNDEELTVARGWQLVYTPASGELELVSVDPADVDTAPDVVVD